MAAESPLERLAQLADELDAKLLAEQVFQRHLEDVLDNCQQRGLGVSIEVLWDDSPVARYGHQRPDGTDPFRTEAMSRDQLGSVSCKLEAWDVPGTPGPDSARNRPLLDGLHSVLVRLLKRHWGDRDYMTMLPRLDQAQHDERLERAIAEAFASDQSITAVHLDLDHFKRNVILPFGDPTGDAILREFGQRLWREFGTDGLVIRKGGEEFSMFFQGAELSAVLVALYGFRRYMEEEPFAEIDSPNTCSIGVAAFPYHLREVETGKKYYKALLDLAMEEEDRAKDDGRNRIRIAGAEPDDEPQGVPVSLADMQRAAIASRVALLPSCPAETGDSVHDYFFNVLTAWMPEALATLQDVVDEVLATSGIELDNTCSLQCSEGDVASPRIHPLEAAMLCTRALLKSSLVSQGPLSGTESLQWIVGGAEGDGHRALLIHVQETTGDTTDIAIGHVEADGGLSMYVGKPWRDNTVPADGVIGRRLVDASDVHFLLPCLIVAIGQNSLELGVKDYAAAVVTVDDRPVSGGGLPDFWQSNVSRVVQEILNNPNVSRIVIVGDGNIAAHTVRLLTHPEDLCKPAMARILSVDVEALESYRARSPEVFICAAEEGALLGSVHEAFFVNEDALVCAEDSRDLSAERRRRRRVSSVTSTDQYPEQSEEVCICETLAQAYPTLIDLLRNSAGPEHSDQMGRRFREFRAFKLVLKDPCGDKIPDYWDTEEAQLESYYQEQFSNHDGLFGRRLRYWGGKSGDPEAAGVDQIQAAIQAVVNCLQDRIASRRIILSVAEPTDDLAKPLGLTGLHILPRFRSGQWHLDFHWTWRTVEAIVGLPFSLYASIRQAEDILSEVNQACENQRVRKAVMGHVVYIASSLHMFLDDGDREIARAIALDSKQ